MENYTNIHELDEGEMEEDMAFLKDNIFNQIGSMLKDMTTNLVKQTLDVGSNLQKVVQNAPGLGKNEQNKKKEQFSEEQIKELEKKRENIEEDALSFFNSNIGHIEIVRDDGQLEKAFFPILPFCHALKMVRF